MRYELTDHEWTSAIMTVGWLERRSEVKLTHLFTDLCWNAS
jgi:hypothetical protein